MKISNFVLGIMEEFPNLHFIAFNKDSVLAVSEKTKKVHFFYEVNEDMSFHFNLLSEVGQIYKQWFEDILKALKYELEAKETDTDYFEIIKNYN